MPLSSRAHRAVFFAGIILCIAASLVAFLVMYGIGGSVTVLVTNKTSAEIKDLVIEYTGGAMAADVIKPGATFKTTVRSTGASHLEIRFTDASGQARKEAMGYFEPSFRGTILIELAPDGTVKYKEELRFGWL